VILLRRNRKKKTFLGDRFCLHTDMRTRYYIGTFIIIIIIVCPWHCCLTRRRGSPGPHSCPQTLDFPGVHPALVSTRRTWVAWTGRPPNTWWSPWTTRIDNAPVYQVCSLLARVSLLLGRPSYSKGLNLKRARNNVKICYDNRYT